MFITLEGIEGSGKTSQLENIRAFLEAGGHDCLLTREPGGTRIGEKIRAILLDPANGDMTPHTELLLYMADRAQHVQSVIQPALAAGKTVVCDRFLDATVVYQGVARGVKTELVHGLYKMVIGEIMPDITFLLDLPPETGLARAWRQIENGERTGLESRFEQEKQVFHEKIRAGYLELARLAPERFRVVDAALDPEQVSRELIGILSEKM